MSGVNHANAATANGLTFNQYHEREMARQAALLTHAAGGNIRIRKQHYIDLPELQLVQSMDHATGDALFITDPDTLSFNQSFEEAK